MSYLVSQIRMLISEHVEFRTIVHRVDYDISRLLPDNELIQFELNHIQPHWVKNKFHLRTAEEFLNERSYHIFKDNLSSEYVLKYMQVLTNRFKPKNLFENFLVQHGLLQKSLFDGVTVEFHSSTSEYSKEFGQRVFENKSSELFKLYDEPRLYPYYQPLNKSGYGERHTYFSKVIIKSIENKPWIPPGVDKVKHSKPEVNMDEYQDTQYPNAHFLADPGYLF